MLKRIIITSLLVVVWLASSWAVLVPGFFRVHDYVHAVRIVEFQRGVMAGHFPVRLSQNLGYGYGMPVFEFYAPLPYAVGALLFSTGLPTLWVLKILFGGCSALTLWGGYKLGKELYGRGGGVLTAALLTLAPYRAVNLFVRGALSEAWGIMALPWIIWAMIKVAKGDRAAGIAVAFWVAVLLLSHNLVSLLALPAIAVFGIAALLFYNFKQSKKRITFGWVNAGVLIGSGVLGLALAAFYVFPAIVEKDYTRVATITQGYFDYHLHFLYLRQLITPYWGYGGSSWGPNDDISFFLGIGQWLALLAGGVLFAAQLVKNVTAKSQRTWSQVLTTLNTTRWWLVAGGVATVAVLMTLLKSAPIWDSVELFSFIQFPWRWLSVVVVCVAMMGGALTTLIKKAPLRWGAVWLLTLVTVGINFWYFRPESWLDDAEAFYYTDPQLIQHNMSDVLQDYIPKAVPVPTTPPTAVAWFDKTTQPLSDKQVLLNRPHEKLLATKSETPGQVIVAVADFPGWYVEVDGQPVPKNTTPQGLITAPVPAGEHLVGVKWGATPVRALSDAVSAVAWIALSLVFVYQKLDTNRRYD